MNHPLVQSALKLSAYGLLAGLLEVYGGVWARGLDWPAVLPLWLVAGLLLWTLLEVVPQFFRLMDWRRWARLAILVMVAVAWWAPEGWAELRGALRWIVAGGIVLGLLTMPRQTITRVLTWVARVVGDLRRFFRAFDRPWQRLEVGMIVIAATAMTLVTFLSVLHRNVTKLVGDTGVNRLGEVMNPSASSYLCAEAVATDGKDRSALLDALSEGGSHPELGALNDCMQAQVASGQQTVIILWLVMSLLLIFATERAMVTQWKSLAMRLAAGLVIAAGFYGFCHGFVWAFPSDIPGALQIASGMLFYLAFFGAAVAAREGRHITVDAVRKSVPDRMQPLFGFGAHVGGAAACFFLAWLGGMQTWTDYIEWAENPALKIYPSIPIPYWTVQLAIPVGLGVAGLRMLAIGLDNLWDGVEAEEDDPYLAAAGIDVDQSELEALLAEREEAEAESKEEAA
ncbi:MAG: hypothetical protein CMH55_08265 [Myxococcales bacterium]|nr:hypothetical protein [Myxococcales bacterium]